MEVCRHLQFASGPDTSTRASKRMRWSFSARGVSNPTRYSKESISSNTSMVVGTVVFGQPKPLSVMWQWPGPRESFGGGNCAVIYNSQAENLRDHVHSPPLSENCFSWILLEDQNTAADSSVHDKLVGFESSSLLRQLCCEIVST